MLIKPVRAGGRVKVKREGERACSLVLPFDFLLLPFKQRGAVCPEIAG